MEDGKRRAFIHQHATAHVKKRQEERMPPTKGTSPAKLFIKRKTTNKVDCPAKKTKVVIPTTVREMPSATKLPPPPQHGIGKGLIMAKGLVIEERPRSSARTCDMPSGKSHPSSGIMIMKTWETMQLRPCGRLAFSAWLRCVTVPFPFCFSITLIL